MKTFRTLDGRLVAKSAPSAEDLRERTLYWLWVHVAAAGFFIACCAASGLL